MQCPSCGANTKNLEPCNECGQSLAINSFEEESTQTVQPPKKSSTLIEFPGVNRNSVPEWRKELSVRVREVQERKAREAAREAVEAERRKIEAAAHAPQLELLPQTEAPPMNPLVAAALKRIERANQTGPDDLRHQRANVATAVAYVPSLEVHESAAEPTEEFQSPAPQLTLAPTPEPPSMNVEPTIEKAHGPIAVPSIDDDFVAPKLEKPPAPKRLIRDDPNDPALNYLDSINRTLRVDEIASHRASAFRRLVCGLCDLLTCTLLASPVALLLYWQGVDLSSGRPLIVIVGFALVTAFLYFTLSVGLAGRTWAMNMFSLRVIDVRTGLIPTGSQSAGRALFYMISLAIAGLGILYALISRDGDTMHDRFTRTAVIKI